ncbi:MAG TPA: YopT-type cysteine protease domain-containing protein [Roseomonas sp.]|jgi:hypothetical protein
MTTKLQDCFLPDARRTGQVVAEFAQSETDPFKTVKQNENGYCAGLTLHWLSLRQLNKPWPRDQASTDGVALAAKASATYDQYVKGNAKALDEAGTWATIGRGIMGDHMGVQSNNLMQIKGALAATAPTFNLMIDQGSDPVLWSSQRGEDFMHEVAVRGSGFYYMSIFAPQGSHAIALHVISSAHTSGVDFFDPNIGHLHYADPMTLRWSFARLLDCYVRTSNLAFARGYAIRMTIKALR